ncbi:carbohydrate ABC transporter permease [Halomonas urumqiensis]|uniref:ABC transporter permease n=1 Tax=Halomonas urumqiensis TaxID=1684789 RepID=A0A2N7UHE0_9GAMM|nr:sugar ABC transporter permease [Halomonas urumqiensis]PMR79868.1 ABC transporter permease [Halomonas urumqiensis]PTB02106.1 sugar ABC transporter permease [Halomonas urumqiensis]GHE21554.1 ABC transporter permease [Halomonas urumqiensis]
MTSTVNDSAPTGARSPARQYRSTKVRRQRVRAAWTFLAPMLVVLALVAGWPLVRTFYFSFTDASLSDTAGAVFIGLENYLVYDSGQWYGVLADPVWWGSVWNTAYFAVVSVSLEVVFGVIVALILNAEFKGRTLVRAAVLIPWAIPTIVSAQMWAWMLNDQFGIINELLMALGIISSPIAWTADASYSMWAVIMVDVWKTTPFVALLALAALQMLPKDCYEAAEVDGIHPVRVFFKVTLPLITPALMVAVIFRLLDALRVFDVIYVLTSNSTSTMSMSIYARQQLVEFQDVGYGSAASTLLFLIIALATIAYLYLGRNRLQLGGE